MEVKEVLEILLNLRLIELQQDIKKEKKVLEVKDYLNLKTISDLSLVGFPNVGKSSIISKITNSKAEIGNYEFTTLNPNIGVLKEGDIKDYLIADIPGLIKGSSLVKG